MSVMGVSGLTVFFDSTFGKKQVCFIAIIGIYLLWTISTSCLQDFIYLKVYVRPYKRTHKNYRPNITEMQLKGP